MGKLRFGIVGCGKIAVDLAAADRMIATTEQADVTLGVLFRRRF